MTLVTIDQSLFYFIFPKYSRQSCIKDFPIIYQNKIYFIKSSLVFSKVTQQKPNVQQGQLKVTHAIMQLTDQNNEKFEKNCFPLGILIDPNFKIKELWGKEKNLSWFKSYLENRKQYPNYNNDVTNLAQIKCGVPRDRFLDHHFF